MAPFRKAVPISEGPGTPQGGATSERAGAAPGELRGEEGGANGEGGAA